MNKEFHQPFIKSLLVVAVVTMIAMISSHYVVKYYYNNYENSTIYTSSFPASSEK